jgi:hypothetical protein
MREGEGLHSGQELVSSAVTPPRPTEPPPPPPPSGGYRIDWAGEPDPPPPTSGSPKILEAGMVARIDGLPEMTVLADQTIMWRLTNDPGSQWMEQAPPTVQQGWVDLGDSGWQVRRRPHGVGAYGARRKPAEPAPDGEGAEA